MPKFPGEFISQEEKDRCTEKIGMYVRHNDAVKMVTNFEIRRVKGKDQVFVLWNLKTHDVERIPEGELTFLTKEQIKPTFYKQKHKDILDD